jgi:hypothetical protein
MGEMGEMGEMGGIGEDGEDGGDGGVGWALPTKSRWAMPTLQLLPNLPISRISPINQGPTTKDQGPRTNDQRP